MFKYLEYCASDKMGDIIKEDLDRHFAYLKECYQYAKEYSHDKSTWNSAKLIRNDGIPIAIEANRVMEGIEPTEEILTKRPDKYFYTGHAEERVLWKALDMGFTDFKNSTMFCPWYACHTCARTILGFGVGRIIGHQSPMDWDGEIARKGDGRMEWLPSIEAAWNMFRKRGVDFRYLIGKIGGVENLHAGRIFYP